MKTVDIDDANMTLADGARRAGQEPLVITERGKPVAVLLPLENTDLETAALSSNHRFLELIERSRTRLREEGSISGDEIHRLLGLI
jgi:antitoxin (DNA-binding transcriptional repressor) of toxin-antitoxin stability system